MKQGTINQFQGHLSIRSITSTVLVSSIHEIITVPDDGKITYEELKEMVTEINHAQVSPGERLTDEVYYYDTTKREFRKGNVK